MATGWKLVLLAGLLAAPGPGARAGGEAKAAAQAAARERAALLQGLPRSRTFHSGGARYRIVGGLRAVLRAPEAQPHEALAAAGASAGDLVEAKGRFLLYREGTAAAPVAAPAAAAAGSAETLPVAVNTGTGGLAVVLGTIAVHLRDASAAEAVAHDLGLELVSARPQLGTAFFRVGRGGDLRAATARLARDRRVRSAEIEVREHFDEPM